MEWSLNPIPCHGFPCLVKLGSKYLATAKPLGHKEHTMVLAGRTFWVGEFGMPSVLFPGDSPRTGTREVKAINNKCPSLFPFALIKYSDRSNLEEKVFILIPSLS